MRNKTSAKTLPKTRNLVVKKSSFLEDQLGVFAKKPFKKNKKLFLVKGPINPKPSIYSFSIGLNQHIEPKNDKGDFDFGHYTNHSCDPNTVIRIINKKGTTPYIKVIARKNIKKGEELTFDYASLEYVTLANSICKCHTKNCRGIIHGFKELPSDIAKKYEKEGMIPQYLLDIKNENLR
jgi:SET domain-containing protein